MFLHLLFMLGHDAAELIDNIPPVISCPAKIFRLWDDIGNAKVRTPPNKLLFTMPNLLLHI